MQSKMKTDRLIREVIRKQINNLFENVQLADKVYYNTKKLSPKVKQIIIGELPTHSIADGMGFGGHRLA